jgi:hypothetical protein
MAAWVKIVGMGIAGWQRMFKHAASAAGMRGWLCNTSFKRKKARRGRAFRWPACSSGYG